MRNRTKMTALAFLNHVKKTSGNCCSTGEDYLLHGHCIAWWNYGKEKPEIHFNLRGYPTVTTRDRINGILELAGSSYRVCQRDFTQYIIGPSPDVPWKELQKQEISDDGTFTVPDMKVLAFRHIERL